jgi:hypothetical protein
MVSFVKSRGVRASLTVLVAAQVLILLSIRFDDERFSFFRLNKTAANTDILPTDENRMEYNYVAAITAIEKFGKNEELKGGITKPQNDLRLRGLQDHIQTEGLRVLRPKDEKDDELFAAKNAKEAKETKAPTNKKTRKKTKASKNNKSAPKPSSQRE